MADHDLIPELIRLRQRLHRHAELAGREHVTSRIIRDFLEGIEPDRLLTGLGGNGLAAVLEGAEAGPTVFLRAELDAVGVNESDRLPYRSATPGVAVLARLARLAIGTGGVRGRDGEPPGGASNNICDT